MRFSTLAAVAGVAGALFWACGIGWADDVPAGGEVAPDPAKIAPDGDRFLFIVETSGDNRKFEESNRQTLFDLIVGGVHGQMRNGDTFGIWTFSDEVRSGDFPMTIWESDRSLEIATRVAAFLQKQKYARKPKLGSVVAQLRLVADRVGDFNVLIASSGRDALLGTPFDQNINAAYQAYAKRPAKLAHLPLITCFIVRKGRPVRASVVLAGDRVNLPERPPAVAKALHPPVKTNTPPAVVAEAPRKKVMQIVTLSNPPSPALITAAAVTSPTNPPTTNVSGTSPASPFVSLNVPAASEAKADPSSSTLTPTPLTGSGTTATTLPSMPAAAPASDPSAAPGFTVTSVSSILSAAAVAVAAPPLRVAAREPASSPVNSTAAEPSTSPDAEDEVPTSSLPVTPLSAVAAPGSGRLGAGATLALGGTLLGASSFLLILVLRRSPRTKRGSLITQSMQRE